MIYIIFLHVLKAEIYQINKIKSSWNCKNSSFWGCKIAKFDFTQNFLITTLWAKSDELATLIMKREDKYKSWMGEVKEEAFEANVNREEIERKGKVHSWNHRGSKEEKV